MGSEWKEVKLEQIAVFKNGKKIDENERKANGRYYIYGSNGIIGKTDKFLVCNDCIIIGRVGAYCGSLQYSKGPSWVTDNAIFCLTNKDTDLKFLFYVLKTIPIRDMAGGSAQPLINQEILNNITITCPPLPEQQKIASILSAFDDKIELNNEMNKTLEEIAQAIFKHWFIDFEFPNENGEPYKSSGGEFVDSELGPIPKGWKVGTLKEICHINMGQSPPSSTYNTEGVGIAFYQGVKDFGFRYPSCTIYCSEPKKIAEMGDILLSVRAPVGEVNIAIEKCCIGRGLCSLRMKEGSNNYLYYLLLNQKKNWTKFESGSVFTAINKASIENLPIICPPNYIYREFNELVQPVDEKILNNTKMNIFLSQLRDTLLPKLISGEIRVV